MQHQLDFMLNLQLDLKQQISPQLADQMTPLFLNPDDTLEQRKKLIITFLNYHQMIMAIGWEEHTGDWDPYLSAKLTDGTEHTGESGYDNAKFSGNYLLVETPDPNDPNGEIESDFESHWVSFDIMQISELRYHYY